jgi:hypothetical protein
MLLKLSNNHIINTDQIIHAVLSQQHGDTVVTIYVGDGGFRNAVSQHNSNNPNNTIVLRGDEATLFWLALSQISQLTASPRA